MDIETNRIVQTFTLDALFSEDSLPALRDVLFSPNGNRLAGYTRAGLVLWDVPTGTLLWKADYSSSTDLFPGSDIDGMTSIKSPPVEICWSRHPSWLAVISESGRRGPVS